MKEILHLPLGNREWANNELNDLMEETDGQLTIVGVYTDGMSFSAEPVMVIVVTR